MQAIQQEKARNNHKIAITATIADAEDHIDFFIRYHSHIGIYHFFIFIDDNNESTHRLAAQYRNVTAIPRDDRLLQLWKHVPIHRDIIRRCLINREVMARQELNVFVAESLAKQMGIDWLIHIDLDELFFLNGNSLSDHFTKLSCQGAGGINYLNYEAIPLNTDDERSQYLTTTYFKKNFFKKGHWFFSEKQKKFIDGTDWLKKHYFNYYQNGKSAANLHYPLIVDDVHSMRGSEGKMVNGGHSDPLILHFPCMNFRLFREKYERLGNFGNLWRGLARAGKFIDTIHLQARDTYISGDDKEFEKLYKANFILNQSQISTLIKLDLAREIQDIQEFAEKLSNSTNTSGNVVPSDKHAANTDTLSEFDAPSWDVFFLSAEEKGSIYNKLKSCHICQIAQLSAGICRGQFGINFVNLSEARLWIRRHPVLKKIQNATIKTHGRERTHVVELDGLPLLDFDNPKAVLSLVDVLKTQIEKFGHCVFHGLENCYFKGTTALTEFDHVHRQIQIAYRLADALGAEYSRRVCFVLPEDVDRYLLPSSGHAGYIDMALPRALLESLDQNTTYPLAVYLSGRYPRSSNINWSVIDLYAYQAITTLTKKIVLSRNVSECHHALLLALGGSMVISHDSETSINRIQQLADIRQRYMSVFQSYPRQLYAEHPNIIVLKIVNDHHIFTGLFNITTTPGFISSLQLDKTSLLLQWNNLLTEQPFSIANEGLTLGGFEYLWLFSSTNQR